VKMAFIHPDLYRTPRGMERYIYQISNALVRQGADVTILTWKWTNPIYIDSLDSRVHVHVMPTTRYYNAQTVIPWYVLDLVRYRYDFVWIGYAWFGEAEALSIARFQPFGVVFHYPFELLPNRYHEFQRYGLIQRAAHIVSVSQYVSEGVRTAFGRDSTVIHHGVDTNRFAPDKSVRLNTRRSLGIPMDAPLIISACALEERKGVQWILSALPGVIKQLPSVIYLIVGDGPYRTFLENLTISLGIADHVKFLGNQKSIAALYEASDLCAVLASGEASSLTTLEALACGLPVIASNLPPFNELLTPAYGVMVNYKDANAVSTEIIDLFKAPLRLHEMGRAGREKVASHFTWSISAQRYLQLLTACG
jgi:glycosyltransferase involved in cell wall biosynthesis